MIRHIVMWKFRSDTDAEQTQFLEGLRRLEGELPQIRRMEICRSAVENSEFDALLVADFDSLAELERYKKDPRHLAISAICKAIRTSRSAIDVEL